MRMPERVIFLDPGPRPGWATARLAANSISALRFGVLQRSEAALHLAAKQAALPPGMPASLYPAARNVRMFDVIGYETFRPVPKGGSLDWIKGDDLVESRFIGQLELIADLSGAKLIPQEPVQKTAALASMPATLRAIMDDAGEQHAKDAILHLWLYAFRNFVTDPRAVVID